MYIAIRAYQTPGSVNRTVGMQSALHVERMTHTRHIVPTRHATTASSRAVEAPRKAAAMPMREAFQPNMPLALSRATAAPATVLVSQPKRTKPKVDGNGYHEGGREERAGMGAQTPIHANGAAHGDSR